MQDKQVGDPGCWVDDIIQGVVRLDYGNSVPLSATRLYNILQCVEMINTREVMKLMDIELRQAQMLALRRYRLKLAAIDGHELPADQPHLATELDECAAGRLKSSAVVLAKISNGLEIRCQSAQQPHHLDIALALGFQASGGADALKVTV